MKGGSPRGPSSDESGVRRLQRQALASCRSGMAVGDLRIQGWFSAQEQGLCRGREMESVR